MSIVLDFTWDPVWLNIVNALRAQNLPYVRVDISIRPYVRAFIQYLQAKNIFDSALVFQDVKGKARIYCGQGHKLYSVPSRHTVFIIVI